MPDPCPTLQSYASRMGHIRTMYNQRMCRGIMRRHHRRRQEGDGDEWFRDAFIEARDRVGGLTLSQFKGYRRRPSRRDRRLDAMITKMERERNSRPGRADTAR